MALISFCLLRAWPFKLCQSQQYHFSLWWWCHFSVFFVCFYDRTIPHATEHQSPRPSPPAEKLDLSDSEGDFVTQVFNSIFFVWEEDFFFKLFLKFFKCSLCFLNTYIFLQVDHGEFQHLPHSQPEVHHVPHVVVLDASAACASPNQVEVECVLGYERTPVQVICHNQQSFSKQSLSKFVVDINSFQLEYCEAMVFHFWRFTVQMWKYTIIQIYL